jgi:hypothetical protein
VFGYESLGTVSQWRGAWMEYYCGCKSVIYRNHRKILVTSSTTSIAYNLGTLSASKTCTPMRTIDLAIECRYMLDACCVLS